MSDLHAALLTPPGEGGISIIALSGPGAAAFAASRLRGLGGRPGNVASGRLAYGRFHDASGEPLDEVIVAAADESFVEINCHGGAVPSRRILQSLAGAGVHIDAADRFMACRSGGQIERDALGALTSAFTDLAARLLAAQVGGALRRAVEDARQALAENPPDGERAMCVLTALADSAALGTALTEAPKVAVVGPVNAGKSTLLNALAGFARTIVSEVAGTTRDAVETPAALLGVPVMLTDTAGAGLLRGALDLEAQRRALRALEGG